MMQVYVNGKFVEEADAVVSVFDRGFRYGDGLFETLRAYSGHLLFLKEHLERLRSSAISIAMDDGAVDDALKNIKDNIEALLAVNKLTDRDAYVRITMTRGGASRTTHLPPKALSPTIVIETEPIDSTAIESLQAEGVSAIGIEAPKRDLSEVKSLNYLANVLGKNEAAKAGAYEAVFISADGGCVFEGTATNIFIVKNGVIKTPPIEAILAGITRAAVIMLARKEAITVIEEDIFLEDIFTADEVFLTNSIVEILPLIEFDGKAVGTLDRSPLTRLIQSRYKALA